MNHCFGKLIPHNLGLLVHDYFKGTNVKSTLNLLNKSQYWDDKQMEKYRLEKLKKLWDFVIRNNEFYREKFSNLISGDFKIGNLSYLSEIPILSKDELRNNNLLSNFINPYRLSKGKTGGTTGPPVLVYKNTQTRSFACAAYYRWYYWMGIKYGDPVLTLWGSSTVLLTSFKKNIYKSIRTFFDNDHEINSFNINDKTIENIIDKLFKINPVLIKGYLSAILQLADYLNKKNLTYHPKAISTTTETLLPPYRKYLANTFNCPVYDQYASTEITGVAFECSKHNGLHISNEHVIVEILNEKGKPVFNKKGRIVITDLDNFAMPFIRFEIGDIGLISTKRCSCGITLPILKSINGRSADTIILKNGSKVHGVFFTDILYELRQKQEGNRITRFQVRQSKEGYIDFYLESIKNIDIKYIDKLKNASLRFFHEVNIMVVPKLENDKSGKFRYVVSELNQSTLTKT